MKKTNFLYAIAIVAILFSACQPEPKLESKLSLDDFETVNLPSDNVTVDSTNAKFVNGNGVFSVNSGGIWNGGIVCSAQTDTVSGDYTNQYSSISGTGAPESNYISTKYGVVYGNGSFTCAKDPFGYFTIKSMMLNNSTYTYRTLVNGNAFSRKFVAGDWFKVSIIGIHIIPVLETDGGVIIFFFKFLVKGNFAGIARDHWTRKDCLQTKYHDRQG